MWLPIALADLCGWLAASATLGETRLPRADILDGWHLPELAKAVRNDEKAAEEDSADDELIAGINWLEKTFGGK